MKLKKILASILCVAMVLSTMSFTVLAADTDIIEVGTGKAYETWSAAVAAAADADEDKAITYHIYGKVEVDSTAVWASPRGTSGATTINFVGMTDDAEISITASKQIIATDAVSDMVAINYTGLILSRPNGSWSDDLAHANQFFTTWMRGATNGVVTYTGCTFLNGTCANTYNETVYTDCNFKNETSNALWIMGGAVEVVGGTVEAAKGIKTYNDNPATVINANISDVTFDVELTPAVIASAIGAVAIENIDATACEYGVIENGVAGGATATVTIDGKTPSYVATTTNKYGVTIYTTDMEYAEAVNEAAIANGIDSVVNDVVAVVDGTYYTTLKEAISNAVSGDTIYLMNEINEGSIKLPATIINLTIDGQGTAVVKDTVITAADGNSVNYQGLAIKNTTFDNSRFVLGGVRNGDVIYKDIVFDNNKFMNIVNTASMAAVHMNLASDDNEYIENFTFTNNVIDGVTGSNNSGVLLKSIKGDVVFEGNTVSNVAWNAVQVATAKADANLVIKNNSFASNGSSVLNIAAAPSAILENNAVVNDSGRIGLWYPAEAKIGDVLYIDIQTAINNAEAGDTITILAGEYDGFNVPVELNNVIFVGETDADGNNLVTIKTLEEGIESHNGGIFVQAETTAFKNLNFTAGTVKGVKSGWMSSSLGNTNGDTGMSSSLKNLTVENCNFVGSGVQYAIWTNQGNVTVKNSTITNYDTAVDTYGIGADQKMVIENTEIADVRNAFHTGEAVDGSQIVVTETTIDSDVINIGGAAAVTITSSEISNAVITTYTDNNQMTISDTLLINSVINEEAKGTYNSVNIAEDYDAAVAAVAANNEIISTKLNISFRQVEAGLYDIVLDGEDDIYEFVGAELTFDNDSLTAGNEYMNYEILGINGTTNAEKSIEKDDTYALRLVDGAERMSGRDLVIGQVKFFGQGDINFTVSEGKVVTTEYGTNLGQYYTLDADDTTADTLTVNAITNGAVEEVTRDVVVNVAYKHALNGTYWKDAAGNAANQITVTLKDGFGNIYGPFDVSDEHETIPDVKLGRLTVTLEAPGFRRYVYNTTLEAGADENDALVLNFWNDIKRDTVQSPLAEIEAGVSGETNKNFVVGDIVMDYTVDEYDLAAVTSYYGMYELEDADKYIRYDLNRDGNIDITDVHYVLHTLNN